jgi:hypothetical protein
MIGVNIMVRNDEPIKAIFGLRMSLDVVLCVLSDVASVIRESVQ